MMTFWNSGVFELQEHSYGPVRFSCMIQNVLKTKRVIQYIAVYYCETLCKAHRSAATGDRIAHVCHCAEACRSSAELADCNSETILQTPAARTH